MRIRRAQRHARSSRRKPQLCLSRRRYRLDPGRRHGRHHVRRSGPVLGSNGLLVVTGTVACGSRTFPAGTTVIPTSLLGRQRRSTYKTALIRFCGSVARPRSRPVPTTIRTTMERLRVLPAGATIVDGVSWSDGGAGDITYGTVLLTARWHDRSCHTISGKHHAKFCRRVVRRCNDRNQ